MKKRHTVCHIRSKNPDSGESVGYIVKSKEENFPISNYPLEQTEFLYDSKQGMMIDLTTKLIFKVT